MSQCSGGVRSKLEVLDGWDEVWATQQLHHLIIAVRGIYMGHDDVNQGMYNLVQLVKKVLLILPEGQVTRGRLQTQFQIVL